MSAVREAVEQAVGDLVEAIHDSCLKGRPEDARTYAEGLERATSALRDMYIAEMGEDDE